MVSFTFILFFTMLGIIALVNILKRDKPIPVRDTVKAVIGISTKFYRDDDFVFLWIKGEPYLSKQNHYLSKILSVVDVNIEKIKTFEKISLYDYSIHEFLYNTNTNPVNGCFFSNEDFISELQNLDNEGYEAYKIVSSWINLKIQNRYQAYIWDVCINGYYHIERNSQAYIEGHIILLPKNSIDPRTIISSETFFLIQNI